MEPYFVDFNVSKHLNVVKTLHLNDRNQESHKL
jgi:hypothetical protein